MVSSGSGHAAAASFGFALRQEFESSQSRSADTAYYPDPRANITASAETFFAILATDTQEKDDKLALKAQTMPPVTGARLSQQVLMELFGTDADPDLQYKTPHDRAKASSLTSLQRQIDALSSGQTLQNLSQDDYFALKTALADNAFKIFSIDEIPDVNFKITHVEFFNQQGKTTGSSQGYIYNSNALRRFTRDDRHLLVSPDHTYKSPEIMAFLVMW